MKNLQTVIPKDIPVFNYLVLGYRFDQSGESEERIEYSGSNRIEALDALRNVRQTGHGDIYVDVRGRKGNDLED